MKWGMSVCCAIRFHCLIDKDEGNNGVDQPFKLESFLAGFESHPPRLPVELQTLQPAPVVPHCGFTEL